MQKNNKLFLTAAVSAALLFGGYEISNAYTYSGTTATVDKVAEDENDLVVINKSNIICTDSQNPKRIKTEVLKTGRKYVVIPDTGGYISTDIYGEEGMAAGVPDGSRDYTVSEANEQFESTGIHFVQKDANTIIAYLDKDTQWLSGNMAGYVDDSTVGDEIGNCLTYEDPSDDVIVLLGDYKQLQDEESVKQTIINSAAIDISNNSQLLSNGSISTGVSTTVTQKSSLTAKEDFTTPTLTVADSNVTVGGNASIASGGLKTTGTSKVDVSNGTLTVGSGAVNIAKGGILKAKVLKAAATGTETSVIGSSTNIQGTLTVAGQVKGVTAGTASTDAVNKGQLDSAVNTLTTKIGQGGKTYTAGSDIDISAANAISVKKAGLIASGNTGLVTGGTVYSTTNALNTQIKTTSQEVAKISDKVSSYGKTITSISSSVTSAISNMKNNQANFVDTSLSNISTDGKDVIKQVVRDVLAANTASTAPTTASAKASFLKASFMAAPMRAPASLSAGDHVTISGNTISVDADGTVASGDTGLVTGGTVYDAIKDKADKSYVDEGLVKKADISYVDQGLSQKVNISDFTPVKQQVDTNTADISALKTGKADADGSNINVGSFTVKLNTGKVEKGNTGLVSGGTVYDSLQTKADVGYVNTMGMALDSEIKGTARGLHNEIQDMGNRLTKDINRVGAGAAALAALHPQDFNPDDKWDFAVGYGHYKNANASAVGAFYRPNAGTTVSLAATVGNGDPQISAGVSFKIGMGKNVEKVIITKDKYDAQQKENQEMKEALVNQSQEIEALKQAIMEMKSK